MLFTIRIQCGCGCGSKLTIRWSLTSKGNKYAISPSWEEPSQLSVSQLSEAFTHIKDWQARGGKVANIILERINGSEKVFSGNSCPAEERSDATVFHQTGIRVRSQQRRGCFRL
jgi:hypothetical protein